MCQGRLGTVVYLDLYTVVLVLSVCVCTVTTHTYYLKFVFLKRSFLYNFSRLKLQATGTRVLCFFV